MTLPRFGPFLLDVDNACVRRDGEELRLTPKAFEVLHYLVEHPGRIVTKQELLEAVWPATFVHDAVLKVAVAEVRRVLGDDAHRPRFVETLHRRGYRLLAEVAAEGRPAPLRVLPARVPTLVGREHPLALLRDAWADAREGRRRVVLVGGEAGIGKSTLVDAFLSSVSGEAGAVAVKGQCVEQHEVGEAYLPVLEALGRLGRGTERARLTDVLRTIAPTWLVQLPALAAGGGQEALRRDVVGATRERMLREMAEALEALTALTPLVLVLEDLHWSDPSTLDLVGVVARREDPARLLVLGTYRPEEVASEPHYLRAIRQELLAHRACQDVALPLLSEDAVAAYLQARFPGSDLPRGLSRRLHQRTEGNPLFLVGVVDELVAHGAIVRDDDRVRLAVDLDDVDPGIPDTLRQTIHRQLERLTPEDQRLLEACSACGAEFSAPAAAAAMEAPLAEVEEALAALARGERFLRPAGVHELPDGTITARHRFLHTLYQGALYERLDPVRATRLHRRIAEAGEAVYGERADEIAVELALHFERGRDLARALHHLRRAADTDVQRRAGREAVGRLGRALDLAAAAPPDERVPLRMAITEQRGLARRIFGDMAGAAEDFAAAAAAAAALGRPADEAGALTLAASALSWVDRDRCLDAAERAVAVASRVEGSLASAHARGYLAYLNLLFRGWSDADERANATALTAARARGEPALVTFHTVRRAFFLCLQSRYREAEATAREGLAGVLDQVDPFDGLICRYFHAWALQHRGAWGEAHGVLAEALRAAERNGHHPWAALYRVELAWLHAQCFDLDGARALCDEASEHARAGEHGASERMIGLLRGVLRLSAEPDASTLAALASSLGTGERFLMDWIWEMPVRQAMGDAWLRLGEPARARQQAQRLLALAGGPGERTWLVHAHRLLALAALEEGDAEAAEAALLQGRDLLVGAEAPMAALPFLLTEAELLRRSGRPTEARERLARGTEVVGQLAASLGGATELRRTLVTGARALGLETVSDRT